MYDVGDGGVGGGKGGEGVIGFVEGGGDEGWGLEEEGQGEAEEEEGADEGFGVVHDGMVVSKQKRKVIS